LYIPAGGGYWEAITNGIRAIASAQDLLDIIHSASRTTIYGADATGDDLYIIPNRTDTYPMLQMFGNGGMNFYVNTGNAFTFYNAATVFCKINCTSNIYSLDILETSSSPATYTNYGRLYTKSDNKLYFKDGDGTEHTVAFV